ncbi:hypothetical protein HD554DRAFT_141120 [Boletus coccyginus]|nr:hypothetical protein HD554DRAFT_141120 [Boletus coccyginus]
MAGKGVKQFMRNWYAVEAIPLYAVIGLAVGGAGWYLGRLAQGPSVVWTKTNPTPWNSVKPDENTKLMDPSGNFSKSWTRDKL